MFGSGTMAKFAIRRLCSRCLSQAAVSQWPIIFWGCLPNVIFYHTLRYMFHSMCNTMPNSICEYACWRFFSHPFFNILFLTGGTPSQRATAASSMTLSCAMPWPRSSVTAGGQASNMLHVCCLHAAFVYCMHAACTTRTMYACCAPCIRPYMLHAAYMHTACTQHACCMHVACVLRVCCVCVARVIIFDLAGTLEALSHLQ